MRTSALVLQIEHGFSVTQPLLSTTELFSALTFTLEPKALMIVNYKIVNPFFWKATVLPIRKVSALCSSL